MMKAASIVAAEEWRFWLRSKLGLAAALLGLVLIIVSLMANAVRVDAERQSRESLQTTAEETFRDQPDRHPHRMVHYGHYVFRTAAPLAVIDPGVDPYTGTVMFLEGHHQNSATFSPFFSSAHAGAFARLTPAMAYQVLMPLVLIVAGFASMAREREGGTDRQLLTSGAAPTDLWLGKVLALMGLSGVLLLPLAVMAVMTMLSGEDLSVVMFYLLGYAAYLMVWSLLIAAVSAASRHTSQSLMTLTVSWLAICVVSPAFVASVASFSAPTASKIESDLEVAQALRDQGDGHNASDPAFNRLRSNLLAQYGVDRIEDLPVNFRGVVAEAAEAELTDTMNLYAEKKMAAELAQAKVQHWLSFLSPQLAIRHYSMSLAGTDLAQHQRFLRDAEHTRFHFVQGLNKVHKERLSYADDILRNRDAESQQRARVSSENWQVLDDFEFATETATKRLATGFPFFAILAVWAALFCVIGISRTRTLAEATHD